VRPLTFDDVLSRLSGVRRGRQPGTATALCPVPQHADRKASLSVKAAEDGVVLLKYFGGCSFEQICSALGVKPGQLMGEGGGASSPSGTRATLQHPAQNGSEGNVEGKPLHSAERTPQQQRNTQGLTIKQYAEAKKLPLDLLGKLGLYEITLGGNRVVAIPYQDTAGATVAVRFRLSLDGEVKFKWRSGSRAMLYGLWRLSQARERGFVILVEGESNCHTLWAHGFPAVGLPGATTFKDSMADDLAGIERIYCLLDPDQAGEALKRRLEASPLRARTLLARLDAYKDVSELHLHCDGPEAFAGVIKAALAEAVSFEELSSREALQTSQDAWAKCADLARSDDILAAFSEAVARAGVAGEQELTQVVYLALTSRFTERPVSVGVVGPSAGGKNHVLGAVLEFMPPRAYYALSSMSEHALAYSEEPLDHRFLVIYELAGLNSDFASYLMRSLLSEQRIKYETVEKDPAGTLRARLIDREGPTGLILTTTRAALHPEHATRMLTVTITDTREQTRAVLVKTAQIAHGESEGVGLSAQVDFEQWRALQTWLEGAEHRVIVPYAEVLATMIPPVAVRLRRDFRTLLSLIEARAILHQASRERDAHGRIVADLSDYAAVRELVCEVMSEGVEAAVSATLRETLAVVASFDTEPLPDGEQPGVSLAEIAKKLELDKSSASRRLKVAVSRGYLKNLETRKGRPGRYVTGDSLPDSQELLPTSEALQCCMGVQPPECNSKPATLAQDAQEEGLCSVALPEEEIQVPPPAGLTERDAPVPGVTVPQGAPPARRLQEPSCPSADGRGNSWENECDELPA